MIEVNKIYKEDVLELIKRIPSGSVDVIPIDPPYLYLKGQKLERFFDEILFFAECRRILKKDGFIILFGRGTSFYRWNCMLADLDFKFKEEIVWDKSYSSSPLMAISRVHETISIHSKGAGVIRRVKVPYLEMKQHDIDSIIADIKRLKTTFKNTKSLDAVIKYLEDGTLYNSKRKGLSTSVSSRVEESDRCVGTLKQVNEGMNEKTIIKQLRDHYNTIHPTQKPVRLIERLLQLVVDPKLIERPLAATFFSGSGAHEEACINLGIDFIGCEIDDEYYEEACKRITERMSNSLFAKTA